MTTGYVIKAQYFLPTQVDHLFPHDTWEDIEREDIRHKRDVANEVLLVDNSTGTTYSQYNVAAVIVEEAANGNETERGFANSDDEELDWWSNDEQIAKDSQSAQSFWNGLHDPQGDLGSENSRWDAYKLLEGVSDR